MKPKQENLLPKLVVPDKLKRDSNWMLVIYFLHLVVLSLIGIVLLPTAYLSTIIFAILLTTFGILGATAGAHRLWAHRTYSANSRLRFLLMLGQTFAGTGSIYKWVKHHRTHHKYHCTNYDPFNPDRGFLYAQYLSGFEKDHADQDAVDATIDMRDIEEDRIVMFQHKFYWIMYAILHVLLPVNAPAEYWGEGLLNSILIVWVMRSFITYNAVALIQSGREIWGLKAGEKYPCETNAVFFVNKNYWIQYHYLAPFDYLVGEYGKYATDCTSKFIRAMAAIGWAADLKTADCDAVRAAAFKAVSTHKSVADCLAEIENVAVEQELYLKPVKMIVR